LSIQVVDVPMPMRPLSAADIEAYLLTQEWRGSVGCYQYENRGVHLFDGVAKDQSTIVGLPLQELLRALRDLGVDLLRQPQPPWRL
jgi:septum formation protein